MDEPVSIERILVFNDHLAKLDEMGISIDLGFGAKTMGVSGTQAARLREISAQLALSPGVAGEATQVFRDERLPALYRTALATWIHSDSPADVLDCLVRNDASRREIGRDLRRAGAQPMIVLALAFAGFCFLCVFFYPKLDRVYEQAFTERSDLVKQLSEIRHWMPVWAWLAPMMGLAAFAVFWRLTSRIHLNQLPGGKRIQRLFDSARFSGFAACLLESGNSMEQAHALATPTSKPIDTPSPLLRWAFTRKEDDAGAAPTMRCMERLYRSLANRQSSTWRWLVPSCLAVFVGGMIALVYSMTLFLPVIELLSDFASPDIETFGTTDRGGL